MNIDIGLIISIIFIPISIIIGIMCIKLLLQSDYEIDQVEVKQKLDNWKRKKENNEK